MNASLPTAGLLRRLGALFYDTLLLLALFMVVTALVLPLTRGEAITPQSAGAYEWLYRAALAAVAVLFFGYSWTRSGQTVGMAAWRLKLVRRDGTLVGWADVLRRLAAAVLALLPCGAGYLWILVDRERLAWHDRLSGTRVVVLPKR
jgi:uncharacterized RDD family membrane protein YckC